MLHIKIYVKIINTNTHYIKSKMKILPCTPTLSKGALPFRHFDYWIFSCYMSHPSLPPSFEDTYHPSFILSLSICKYFQHRLLTHLNLRFICIIRLNSKLKRMLNTNYLNISIKANKVRTNHYDESAKYGFTYQDPRNRVQKCCSIGPRR
jgi:hypothetical protein